MYRYRQISFFPNKGRRYSNKHKNISFFKIFKFILVCTIITVFLALFSITISFTSKNNEISNFKNYDDIIWPIVMQDPKPFDEARPPSVEMMIKSALWYLAKKSQNEIDCWSERDNLVFPNEAVKLTIKKLFGREIILDYLHDLDDYFYKFNSKNKEFLVYPTSGVEGFLPHTVSSQSKNGDIILTVGYISPKNQFDSQMSKTLKNKIEKFAKYKLTKSADTGEFYVSAVM